METTTFNKASEAKHLKNAQFNISKVNNCDVSKAYVTITNKHISAEGRFSGEYGIKVFSAPFTIEYEKIFEYEK